MRLILFALLLLSPTRIPAQQILLNSATLYLPPGFTHQNPLGNKDSEGGLVVAQDSSLVIQYDIGFITSARAHPSRRNDFIWFVEHEVNGQLAYTGMFMRDGERRTVTTVLGDMNDPAQRALVSSGALPANFEASVKGERELATFMAIVSSYRPRVAAASISSTAGPAVQPARDAQPLAQSRRSTITGNVSDSSTGAPLAFAFVQLDGTAIVAQTKFDGSYAISNVPAGLFTLRARRIGYTSATLPDFRVAPGVTVVADIKLTQQSGVPGLVVTTGVTDPAAGRREPWKAPRRDRPDNFDSANRRDNLERTHGNVLRLSAPPPQRPILKLFLPGAVARRDTSQAGPVRLFLPERA